MSRTPDERLYSSGSHDTFYLDPVLCQLRRPRWRRLCLHQVQRRRHLHALRSSRRQTGASPCSTSGTTCSWMDSRRRYALKRRAASINMGDIAMNQWQANLYTRTFIDDNKDGVSQSTEAGIPLIPVNVRLPRRQPRQQSRHRLHRHRQLQRDFPAVQLVRGGNRHYPLQEHRHPRRV